MLILGFQHTAARRRLLIFLLWLHTVTLFQHTAARRRLHELPQAARIAQVVSTHSRPKAAAPNCLRRDNQSSGFNTQPPEGGCNYTARQLLLFYAVSTHSRPKAAAFVVYGGTVFDAVSTHSRPKAAAIGYHFPGASLWQFQHTAARRRLPFHPPLRQ